MTITGGCLCKSVRFTMSSPPLTARVCWCRLCQYLSGGNGMASVGFHSSGLDLSGAVTWHESNADSGNRMSRGFCAACGTPLFSTAQARPQVIFVRAGSLDDPNLMAPVANIWTAEAPQWACLNSELPALPGQPPPLV